MKSYDVVIVGAGMAGAGLAAEIAGGADVLLLEAEARPGVHATGRSAAFWTESYGGPGVRPLTSASGPALRDGGYLAPRRALHIGRPADESALAQFEQDFAGSLAFHRVDPAALVPGLKAGWDRAIVEPSCSDIDVARLHQDALAAARRGSADLACDARLLSARWDGGGWRVDTADGGSFGAGLLVDAAGAWADNIASLAGVRPIGIRPFRRTIVQLRVDPPAPADLPLVIDAGGSFYFKPDTGGRLWLSPHDESPADAGDAAPEEIDVALAIDRLQSVVDWRVAQVEHRWAGLRSFAPDRLPVYGFATDHPGFFWCAGQGGFGIQTAPAAAALAAALLTGTAPAGAAAGIDPARYSPERFSDGGQP
ncbi:D-arginine dehydrogenase [Sphingomonas jejuensis]|uniref:D-arginine dehydrogenase n=1 Tax=Sphingomonas jejuensis TaxID=904715 RepID=A0ABX0XI68_9SPHN|nr:FAD-binding oxidoreductase [Sphingomonas jejuensis]NJC32858.1 D-arginine dehydrogenase [Sphingomonas jejuensis]